MRQWFLIYILKSSVQSNALQCGSRRLSNGTQRSTGSCRKIQRQKAPKNRPVLKSKPLPLKSDWTDGILVKPSSASSESFLEIVSRISEPRYSRHPRSCRRGFSAVLPLSSVCLRGQWASVRPSRGQAARFREAAAVLRSKESLTATR